LPTNTHLFDSFKSCSEAVESNDSPEDMAGLSNPVKAFADSIEDHKRRSE
jgi:hypothetical protein